MDSLVWFLVLGLGLWFATQPREQYAYTPDGKIVIDRDFLQSRARHSHFANLMEHLLQYLPEADLTYSNLVETALWRCGSPGADSFSDYSLSGLRALTEAIVVDRPKVTRLGRVLARETYLTALCNQLALSRWERDRPEVFTQTTIKAVVIAGPPRTGSTHLLSMLCQHPSATCLTVAEAMDPVASHFLPPNWLLGWLDYRLWKNRLTMGVVQQLRPLIPIMQRLEALDPMEEMLLSSSFFGSIVHFASLHLPSYDRWFRETDHLEMELGVKRMLQIIQHQRGGKAKMWILKSPQNADQIGPKSKVYPNAQFVFTHRKSFPVMQSWVGMLAYTLGVHCDFTQVDYSEFAEDLIAHQQWSQERILPENVRKHFNASSKLLNVYFDEFMRDPVSIALEVARHAGLDHSQATREVFERFQRNNPQRGSKVLKYDLASLGVTPEAIGKRLEKYETAYGLL
ncbi:hypothetical protein BASA81_003625 [Batrachochytrium salamandrivorans]|nr:hypothetical protein BASA81_003625 [Batrachochytrium salamandrivorans]